MPARSRSAFVVPVRLALAVLLAALTVGAGTSTPSTVTLPPGFSDALVTTVAGPTALAFTPDGRLLVTTQAGQLRVYRAGTLVFDKVAIDLGPRLCSDSERGLVGVTVDPQFASNHFIYLYYTFNLHNQCPVKEATNPNNPVNRVARFVLGDDNLVAASSERILVDNIPSVEGDHNGGDLNFGPDGYLYITIGDNNCNYAGGLCGAGNEASRDEFILLGKILRITRDGGIPPDNPFLGPNSDRCNVTGRTIAGHRCQETYVRGLRNPFRMAFDPNNSGRFYINDVGQNRYEEIDLGQAGADYGWNCREGKHPNSTTGLCNPAPPNMVDPIYEYAHSTGCAAITGGAFVPNGLWPAEYDNTYLFADYVCGKIQRLTHNSNGTYTAADVVTGLGRSSAVAMLFGPYGSTQALYYTTYAGGGQVRRLSTGGAPTAVLTANPRGGALPLTVQFSASGSQDPQGQALTYNWTFGDGAVLTGTTSATTNHTYTAAGVITATVVARSASGLSSSPASVRLYPGNQPPVPVITSPAAGFKFTVGQTITLQGTGSDAEDGTLAGSALAWAVLLHHVDENNPANHHTHPYFTGVGFSNTTTGPHPEDLSAAGLSYLEVRLTATDSLGQSVTVTRTLEPVRVAARFVTVPAGLQLTVNGEAITAPRTLTLWQGWSLPISAPATQTGSLGQTLTWQNWSDQGAATHTITAPGTPITYTAAYAAINGSLTLRNYLPIVEGGP
jgi:glucose/arabinose dehydrogenase